MSTSGPETAARERAVGALAEAGRALSTAVVLFHTNLAARLGLGPTEVKILDLVARHGGLSPTALRERTGLAAASISGTLDRLEAKRFVERRPDPRDGRRVQVVHSPRHTEAVRELFDGLTEGLGELHARYDTEQLELIAGYLRAAGEVQHRAAVALGPG